MTPNQVVRHFGTQLAASRELGCYQSTISHWVHAGHIPVDKQLVIQFLTRGRLKADLRAAIKDARRTFSGIEKRLRRAS